MEVIGRKDAKAKGLVRYFTGRPCRRGHTVERYVSNALCLDCQAVTTSAWKKRNRTKCSAQRRAWGAANREKDRAMKRAWNKAHPEGQKRRSREWFLANREKANAATVRWQKANPGRVQTAVRRWRKANRDRANAAWARWYTAHHTPAWANRDCIATIYAVAKRLTVVTGVEWQVDHILPLQSDLVCGLHCEANLQVLPASQNRAKGNRFHADALSKG